MATPIYVTAADIANAVAAFGSSIPVGYFIGTAQRESSFNVNNQEPADQPGGSWGIYALSPREFADELGLVVSVGEFLDLNRATQLFIQLSENRAAKLRSAGGLGSSDDAGGDLWAFLGAAHNRGIYGTLAEVNSYGVNWAQYSANHPTWTVVSNGYGNALINAVAQYPQIYGGNSLISSLAGHWYWWAATIVATIYVMDA